MGESNQSAYDAAVSAAMHKTLNRPVFICGQSGCGKTHLLHAIEKQVNKQYSVILVSAESFVNDLIRSFHSECEDNFEDK